MIWIGYEAAWISTAAAVIAGVYFTGSAWCLWALLLPVLIKVESSRKLGGRKRKMNEIKLKPCPFCGELPYTSVNESNGKKMEGYIQCNNPYCGALIEFEIKAENGFLKINEVINGFSKAEEAWNRRAGEQNE